jgi:diguanylate cyclase (GGDEF)-like protein
VISVLAVAAVGLAWALAVQVPHITWLSWDLAPSYLLIVLLFGGELRPLVISRADGDTDRITVSTTFAVALVISGPLALTMVAQAVAAGLEDILSRRHPLRAAFNIGQYLVTLLATRAVFALASRHEFLAPTSRVEPHDILPALLAAATYFVVNNGAVAVVVAMDQGLNVLSVLREDVRVQSLTSSILLGLGPVAAVVADFSLLMLPLLVLPLLGVQRNALIAAQRQHDALHDGLTGLPNRELFRLRADRAVAQPRDGPTRVAVMVLDLDHFKEVNDTLGHHVGDGLLRQVATRLVDGLPEDITVARLGGDEFAVLMPAAADEDAIQEVARTIARRLAEPVVADNLRMAVQASIGIAICPDHAQTTDILLQRADIALYWAKGKRGDIQTYRSEIDQHNVLRLSLLGDLHSAVDHDEFEMLYQPQVEARTGQVVAIEALMRWRHPKHGVMSPDIFIPLAENTGLIGRMSQSAVRTSLRTLSSLRASGHLLSVAVNISARLLSDLELPTWVAATLLEAQIAPSLLTIEVTESTITADPQRAMQVLHELREIGVRLAIDDFGTGYSSLSYLRRLNPDELKVDKSFVLQMDGDENSAVIVRSTIDLGHGLGLSVVGEGVENAATYQALAGLGCDRIQGFHIARPMSAMALKAWLDAAAVKRPVDPTEYREVPV